MKIISNSSIRKYFFILISLFVLIGITEEISAEENLSNYNTFRLLLKEKKCHKAYNVIRKVMDELQNIEEGAAKHEYFLLLDTTATLCQNDWCQILKDSTIELEYKIDLVKYIDELYSNK